MFRAPLLLARRRTAVVLGGGASCSLRTRCWLSTQPDSQTKPDYVRRDPRKVGLRVSRSLRASHSTRDTLALIKQGKLRLNGAVVTSGEKRLRSGDTVELDGKRVAWEEAELSPHRYIKLHKAAGVICTTDRRVPANVLGALEAAGCDVGGDLNELRRVYPVGRLDADSSGVVLLTSNGDVSELLLGSHRAKPKEYLVGTSPRATQEQIDLLAAGVVIEAPARVNGAIDLVSARTIPCVVERVDDDTLLRFKIDEGRNRQLRRMCEAVGLGVRSLHRVGFAGVDLTGVEEPGSWALLTNAEELLIGARKPPTKNDLRTPEEKAARKAKKEAKKAQKRLTGFKEKLTDKRAKEEEQKIDKLMNEYEMGS